MKRSTELSILISLFLSTALAQQAEFTFLKKGQPAPYDGALLNPAATAEMLVTPEEIRKTCETNKQYEIDRLDAKYKLEIKDLNLRIKTINRIHESAVNEKDKEIKVLKDKLKKHSKQYNWLWFVGGAAVAGTSYYLIDNNGGK